MNRLLGIMMAIAILMAASGGALMATASAQAPDPADQITVTVDPDSGPTGTSGTITVSGGQPGDAVTLTIGVGAVAGVIGPDGTFVFDTFFSGFPGDVIDITAQVGNSSDSPIGSTTFTITAVDLSGAVTPVTTGGESETDPDARVVIVSVDPDSGPTGTNGTITVKGGQPGDAVTLTIGAGAVSGVIGPDGTFTFNTFFSGFPGDVIDITAQVGNSSDSPVGSTTFTITAVDLFGAVTPSTSGGDQETARGASDVSVSVNPDSGPSGTSATITVKGGKPGDPVTLTIDGTSTNGVIGVDGTYTHTTTFFGRPDDVINIEAQVGNGLDSPKDSTTFTITGEPALGVRLYTGGNPITYDGETAHVLAALGDIAEHVESISWFEPETQEWDHWTPGQESLPEVLRRHIELQHGALYWVVVSAPVTWIFPVASADDAIEVSAPPQPRPDPVTRVTVLSDRTRVYDTDDNGDGVVDRRVVIRPDGSRVEVWDRIGDGRFDTGLRSDPNGVPVERWSDANGDGVSQPNERTALSIQTSVDTDGDGRVDHIDIDIDGDGKADIRVMLNVQGKPFRVLIFVPWDDRPVETINLDANGRETSRFVDHDHDGIDDRLQDPLLSEEFVEFDGQDPALDLFPEESQMEKVCVAGGAGGVEILDAANVACDAPVFFVPSTPPIEVEGRDVELERQLELEGLG